MPLASKVPVLRLALGNSFGSGKSFTALLAGSTRTLAFSPPSVTQAAPSGPTITPCGAEPSPSAISSFLPVLGSRRPRKPLRWPVYQTVPSGAGATSWGRDPGVTGKYETRLSAAAAAMRPRLVAIMANKPNARLGRRRIA